MENDGEDTQAIYGSKAALSSKSHADIEDWIRRGVMPDMHPIVKRLDEVICETIPGLRYAVKWKQAYYGLLQNRGGSSRWSPTPSP